MAWFVGSLVVLWSAQTGQHELQAHRHRPWYEAKVFPPFADLLATVVSPTDHPPTRVEVNGQEYTKIDSTLAERGKDVPGRHGPTIIISR